MPQAEAPEQQQAAWVLDLPASAEQRRRVWGRLSTSVPVECPRRAKQLRTSA